MRRTERKVPIHPLFIFCGRFSAKTKRPVTSEAKMCLKTGFGRLKIHFVTGKFKNYFYPFFYPKTLLQPRGIGRICLGKRARPPREHARFSQKPLGSGSCAPRSLQGASKMNGKENSKIWARNGSKYTF